MFCSNCKAKGILSNYFCSSFQAKSCGVASVGQKEEMDRRSVWRRIGQQVCALSIVRVRYCQGILYKLLMKVYKL